MTSRARFWLMLGLLLAASAPLAAAGASPDVTPAPAPEVPLSVGQAVERPIQSGDVHVYRVPGGPGDFIRLKADEHDGDLELTLKDASGRTIRKADDNDGYFEEIARVVSGPAPYRLEVRPADQSAPANRYRLELLASRAPQAEDLSRDRIDHLVEEITALGALDTKEGREKAIVKSQELAPLWEAVSEPVNVVRTRFIESRYVAQLGDHAQAIAILEGVLPLIREARYIPLEFVIHNDIARYQNRIGESQRAVEHYREALRLNALTDRVRERAPVLNNLGVVYRRLGQFQEALAELERALPDARRFGLHVAEADILNNIGLTRLDLGQIREAIEILKLVPDLRRGLKDREGEANAIFSLGAAYGRLGDPKKARELYEQALPLVREAGSRYGEAYVLTSLGLVSIELGDHDRALAYLREALPLRRAVGDLDGEAATLRALAAAQRAVGALAEARTSVEAAIGRYELLRGSVATPSQRASYFTLARPAYDLAIGILMDMHAREPGKGFDTAALEMSERARARSLVETLSESRVDFRKGVDPGLLERETRLRSDLRDAVEKQLRLTAEKPGSAEQTAADLEVSRLSKEVEEADAEIRTRSPRFSALTSDRPLPVAELQALLGPDTALLEYALTAERSYVWAVTRDGVRSAVLPPLADVEKAARDYYDAVSAPSQFKTAETPEARRRRIARARRDSAVLASALSKMLLEPVQAALDNNRIVIAAEGALLFVPYAALPVPGSPGGGGKREPMAARHELTALPSAAVLAVVRHEGANRAPARSLLAVLADPVFDSGDSRVAGSSGRGPSSSTSSKVAASRAGSQTDDALTRSAGELGFTEGRIPRLAFSRREAQAIFGLAPAGTARRALDFDASLATAMDPTLARYRWIHFATHGLINSAHPELSGIVLSLVDQQGRPRPGFLTASEIYGLDLPVDLVVLSACQTALGKQIRGEGLIGLTSGFLHAGARSVVASLWRVDDAATAELMIHFYRGMLKDHLAPAAALNAAQRELARSRRWGDPFYWAGFVFQGDWADPSAAP